MIIKTHGKMHGRAHTTTHREWEDTMDSHELVEVSYTLCSVNL